VTAPVFGEPKDAAAAAADDGPDAFAKGWAVLSGHRETALFVLDGQALGIGPAGSPHQPRWIDLSTVTALDAIGEPAGGMLEVEMVLDNGDVISAGWPDHFTDPLLGALRRAAGQAPSAPVRPQSGPATTSETPTALPPQTQDAPQVFGTPAPVVSAPVQPAPVSPVPAADMPAPAVSGPAPASAPPLFGAGAPPSSTPSAPAPPFADPAPAPSWTTTAPAAQAPTGPTLVLEDVVYLGGYPGQPKKRKKCVATLTRDGMEVTGPSGLAFRIAWDVVRSVEAQNADEARFRMNTKIHRDATALVVECQQDVTILLEARDCPTVPLRSAITSLVDGLRVVVV
jgi:hypothetical protein